MKETLLGDRYMLLDLLGTGGMSEVYRAQDQNLQREVAVKILKDPYTGDPSFRAHFQEEARAAANLAHPNIVTIFDFGQDYRRYFIVMEYISGTDLKTLSRRRKRIPVKEALDLMIQICAGVGYAHRAGLVHCDLKPQNVLVTPDGHAKITDFGISRALASIHPAEHSEVVWGSPRYFSPEQASGGPPSPASDVYSLGVVMFELLTGSLPFTASDSATLADLHLSAIPPSARELEPTIPVALEQILEKVLSKEPAARYRTADQLGRVLQTIAEHIQPIPEITLAPPQAPPQSPPEPTPGAVAESINWLAVVLGLLAFLAVGGLVPLWLWVCLLYPSCPLNAG